MMNANRVRQWLLSELQGNDEAEIIRNHMCAVSTALNLTSNFGINSERVFGFWDWVGGRFSVTSAVGVLPLSL